MLVGQKNLCPEKGDVAKIAKGFLIRHVVVNLEFFQKQEKLGILPQSTNH